MKIKKISQSAGVIADVVNSLDSNSSTDALSAAAGKELNSVIVAKHAYSTVEKKVGTWINGKPTYRKTVIYTPTETIGELNKITDIFIGHGIQNFESLCAQATVTSDGFTLPAIGCKEVQEDLVQIDYGTYIRAIVSDNIILRIVNDQWNVRTWYITIEYTKTTDPIP